ncbi:hypothetical protein ABPG75_000230 [Micractinium tetrahymenae]
MPPKKAKAKGKEAPEEGGSGTARAPKAVLDAYASYRSKQDDASLEALVQLVEGGVGGSAACVALAKASMLHAALLAGEGEAGEAEAARLLQQAVEAAVHGVLRYKSAQLLNAALKLLGLTYVSPHQDKRRAAVFKLLQHGCDSGAVSQARDAGLDQRVLPLAALAQVEGVPRGTAFLGLRSDKKPWWDALPLERWSPPEAEWLGSERWPWEFRAGKAQSFEVYLAERRAEARERLGKMAHADGMGRLLTTFTQLDEDSIAGGTASAAIEALSKQRRQLLEQNELYRQPVRERLANAGELLPPERAARLRKELKLRNDDQLDAAAHRGARRAEQGKEVAEQRIKQKAAQRQLLKAQEAEAARVEAALGRSKVISSYLALHLPPGACLPDLLALLEREGRLPLAALEAGLERLRARGALPEGEAAELRSQLVFAAEAYFTAGGAEPLLAFRLPRYHGERYREHAWRDPLKYRATLETGVVSQAQHAHAKLLEGADRLLANVFRAVDTMVYDTNAAMRRLHQLLAQSSLQEQGAQGEHVLARSQKPWEHKGTLWFRKLPFLQQGELLHPRLVWSVVPFVAPNAQDMQEVFPGLQQQQQPASSRDSSSQAEEETAAAGGRLADGSSVAETEDAAVFGSRPATPGLAGPLDDAGDAALGPLPSPGSGGYTSAGEGEEQQLLDDSDLGQLEQPFVGRGSRPLEGPSSPSTASRSPSEYGSGQSEGEEYDAARQLEAAGYLSNLLQRHLAARPEMLRMFGAAHFLPDTQQGRVPDKYSKAPLVQLAYRLADACLRPALLGGQLIACSLQAEALSPIQQPQQEEEEEEELQLDPEELARLAAAWESAEPPHVLLARLMDVSETEAEEAVRSVVNGLMRGEGEQLTKAKAAGGALEGPMLLGLLWRQQLDACADVTRVLTIDPPQAGQMAIEEAEQRVQKYKRYLAERVVQGLYLLQHTSRLTAQQMLAVDSYVEDLTPNLPGWYWRSQQLFAEARQWQEYKDQEFEKLSDMVPPKVHAELEKLDEGSGEHLRLSRRALEEFAGEEYRTYQEVARRVDEHMENLRCQGHHARTAAALGRVVLLPVRALERLHAFVCVLAFHAFGSPEEVSLAAMGDMVQRRCTGQLVPAEEEQGPGSKDSMAGSHDGSAPLFEGRSLVVRSSGLAVALGLHTGMSIGHAVEAVARFAAGLAVVDTGAAPTVAGAAAQQQQQQEQAAQGGKQGGKPVKRQGAATAADAGGRGDARLPGGPLADGPIQLAAQPWQQDSEGDMVFDMACRYMALAACLEELAGLLDSVNSLLHDAGDLLRPLEDLVEHQLQVEGCSPAYVAEELVLAAADSQLQLMWQAQRALDICDAFGSAMRSHLHRLEAHWQRASGGRPPSRWALPRPLSSQEEVAEAASAADEKARGYDDDATDSLRKTSMGWKNWVAIVLAQPSDRDAPRRPHRQQLASLDRLRKLLRQALARAEARGGDGEGSQDGGGGGSPLSPSLSDLDLDLDLGLDELSFSDDEGALPSSSGRLGGRGSGHPPDPDWELERCMHECVDALQGVWLGDRFRELRRRLVARHEELRATQGEAYRTLRLLLGQLLRRLGCAGCPADTLARCMLAHLLPEQWQQAVEQAEAQHRKSTWEELIQDELAAAPTKKKKKKKGKKGGAAAQGAQAAGAAADKEAAEREGEEAGEEEDLALLGLLQSQRQQQAREEQAASAQQQRRFPSAQTAGAAPAVPADQQEGYQRMLREYEEAQQAQQAQQGTKQGTKQAQQAAKQAAKQAQQAAKQETKQAQQASSRSSSRASAGTVVAPSQAAAVADTASSAGASSTAAAAGVGEQPKAVQEGAAEADEEQQHSLAALQAASQAFDWSGIEGADAEARWQQGGAAPTPADWQEAPSHRPTAKASAGAAAAAGSKPGRAASAEQQQPEVPPLPAQPAEQQRAEQRQQQRPPIDPSKPRVVGWDGSWVCKCGRRHRVSEACLACKTPEPCRDYLKSSCPYRRTCRFSHPQFALESPEPPPRALVANPKALPPEPGKQPAGADDWRVRVVSWRGEWKCPCELTHFMQHPCPDCGYPSPCRDWLRGNCRFATCSFPHPPFDLPPGPPPPPDVRVVRPREGMPVWRGAPPPPSGRKSAAGAARRPASPRSGPASPTAAAAARQASAAMLRAAPPSAVAALAASLGMSVEGLEALQLPPDELAAALETVQEQAGHEEQHALMQAQQQARQGPAQQQQQHKVQHIDWQQQRQPATAAAAMPAPLPVVPATAAVVPPAPAGAMAANSHAATASGSAAGSSMRIVGGDGSWVCHCGCLNPIAERRPGNRGGDWRRRIDGLVRCGGCRQDAPCRHWMLGKCTASACRYPHPPFDEASWAPARGATEPRAVLWEGAPRYVHSHTAVPPPPLPQQSEQQQGWSALDSLPVGPVAAISQPAPQLQGHQSQAVPASGLPAASMAAAAGAASGGEEEDLDELLQIMGVSAPAPAPAAAVGAPPAAPPPSDVATPGLRNEAGEYNCFLNVIIQCLWRCADFRQQIMAWGPETCARDPVLAALHSLFHAFAAEEAQRRAGGPLTGTAARRGTVDPSQLRQALSVESGEQFRVGEMNDAGEVLLTLYERTISMGAAAELAVKSIFGLPVEEQVDCVHCGKTTHCNSYTQFFYNIQAAALQQPPGGATPRRSMGQLFKQLESLHQKSCDKDLDGCGAKNNVSCRLTSSPQVFAVQLAWESHREEPQSIAATLAAIDEKVDLADVYLGVQPGRMRYQLRSMVCYYGQHYSALVWADDLGAWLMFDDAAVSRVGGWEAVRRKCEAGRIQPSVLFYEGRPAGTA